ncbi:MAG: glycosyltransferase [Cytophagales bacterium]|nr:glycosyltransferase [Cytophagales bacterium]
MPLVSVVMPVYNGMPYLPLAVESILNQTFTDFELILVEDCSTDESLSYLMTVSDTRIVLIQHETNKGVTKALQTGMLSAKGEFIARLDADDIAKPDRFEYQVLFLKQHPKIGLLASSVEYINEIGDHVRFSEQRKNEIELRWSLLFKNPIIHSSVMIRSALLKKYALGFELPHSEDYDLWTRLLQFTQGCIINKHLTSYRINPVSWTYTKSFEQKESGLKISLRELRRYSCGTEQELTEISVWVRKGGDISNSSFRLVIQLLKNFIQANRDHAHFSFVVSKIYWIAKRVRWSHLLSLRIMSLLFSICSISIFKKQTNSA